MRAALIGDVHTNVQALDAVIEDAQAENVKGAWGLGDWLGYLTASLPWAIWDKLQGPLFEHFRFSPGLSGVIGNHDIAVCSGIPAGQSYNDEARNAIMKQRNQLEGMHLWSDEFRPWLCTQPYLLSPVYGVYLAHGAFKMTDFAGIPFTYPGRDEPYEDSFQGLREWVANGADSTAEQRARAVDGWMRPLVLITGHTHIQGLWQRDPSNLLLGGYWPTVPDSTFDRETIRSAAVNFRPVCRHLKVRVTLDQPLWINPGSVGQRRDLETPLPREGDWARYAILDWNPSSGEAAVSLRWIPYVKEGRGKK